VCGGTLWDRLALGVVVTVTLLVAATFQDYGITSDEYVQQVYGEKLWAFYLSGFADRSAFHFQNLYLYGGLFDMVAVVFQHVSPFETYDTRHLLCGLVGVAGIVATWRLARGIDGPRTGFLAAALLALSASWYGAMFNNTKDIPFAVGMTWLLHFTCLIAVRLPRPRMQHVVAFGVVLGLTLAVRVGAVLAIAYLGVAAAIFVAMLAYRKGWRASVTACRQSALALLPILPVALPLIAMFWPWAVFAPQNALTAAANLTTFHVPTVFNAQHLDAQQVPVAYLPTYLALKLPELTLLGLIFATVRAGMSIRAAADWPTTTSWLLVVTAAALPLIYVLMTHPGIYHGVRHFFFLVPPLCVLAAGGLDGMLTATLRIGRRVSFGAGAAILLAAGQYLWMMVALHPHEYVYYNMFTGGIAGADRKFEMDYWQNFMPEALQALVEHIKEENHGRIPERIFRVDVCGSDWLKPRERAAADTANLRPYLPPNFQPARNLGEADFFIATTNAGCADARDGKVIIEVERLNVVLGVIKDRRPGTMAQGSAKQIRIR